MKLLICDNEQVNLHNLPEEIQNFYIVNYLSHIDNISEMLTLEAGDNAWNIVSNKNIEITLNGNQCDKAPLLPYIVYNVYFSVINRMVKVVSVPSNEKFRYASSRIMNDITIGQEPSSTICCMLPSLHSNHAKITTANNITYLNLCEPTCDVYVNNRRVKVPQIELKYGDTIFIDSLKIIWLDTYFAINNPNNSVTLNNVDFVNINMEDAKSYTEVTESERNVKLYGDNDIFFHTPKIKSYIKEEELEIDSPPEKDNTPGVPLILSVGSSAIIGISSCITGISAVTGLMNGTMDKMDAYLQLAMCFLMLISCFAIPIIADIWQKNQRKKREDLRQRRYRDYLAKNVNHINETIKQQETILREKYLTLDEIVTETANSGYNLWSREVVDKDFLTVRLGIGNMPAYIKVSAQTEKFSLYDDNLKDEVVKIANDEKLLNNVPITISMIDNRITPIVVQTNQYKEYINAIMLQLMFYYSALDLKIVVFTNENLEDHFSYLRYSNHCWSVNRDIRFFATNEIEANQLSMYLEQEYNKRLPSSNATADDKKYDGNVPVYKDYNEYYLIVTDDFKSFKDVSIINRIINSDINLGFSLLVFSESLKNLPSRLEKFIVVENGQSGLYNKTFDNTYLGKFSAEYLTNYDIHKLAHKISNIPLPVEGNESNMPKSLSFLDLYNVGKVEHLNILSRWRTNTPMTSLNAPIGVQANYKPIGLDLHEKAHGPHGLIAGSTGSGKSEFIITYILSMAINYHPYEVQFVLIDYKGGGLAGAFEKREKGIKIPHLIGTITNLDKSEMNRTLVSIKSELERRQIKFNKARDALGEGTIDIYKYQRLFREGKVSEPISHLFIISDEFAELKQQQPEFMDELVSTARIGRSLGVHLILATQKPSGVVNDQIWSNSRFKVCLKVQTSEDSFEVLKRDEASKIRETGRFYLQVGNDELFELGQSAWAGDKYYPAEYVLPKVNDSIDFISNDGTITKSVVDDRRQKEESRGEQLPNIVQYLYDIAVDENIKFSSLWLPNIPADIYLGNIVKKYEYKPVSYNIDVLIGEYDKPTNQEQGLLKYPLDSNILIFGSQGSGKENLLATMIYSTCVFHTPEEINYYILDFGSETLSMFSKMPHVGSFITSDKKDLTTALFLYLEKQIQKRKDLFSEYQGNYKFYCEKSGKKLPLIVTVLNSYEGFRENCDMYDEYLIHLLREGQKYGIIFMITSVSTNSVKSSMLEYFNNKIVLQSQDPFDYQYILQAPRELIPSSYFGRGITMVNGSPCEFQTAFITTKDEVGTIVRSDSKKLLDYYKYKIPEIKAMPKHATFDDLCKNVKLLNNVSIGYNTETAELISYDFIKNKLTLILGEGTTEDNTFMFTIIDLIDNIKNITLNIFDISSSINTDGNANYYNADFAIPFANVLDEQPENMQVNIIIGIGFAKDLLSEEEYNSLTKMIVNANNLPNNTFIIFDNYSRFQELKDTPLYQAFDRKNGFWYGEGFDTQDFYDNSELTDSDLYDDTVNKVYYIVNNKYSVIKGVGYTEVDDE